ncbi:helix-turn-helix domain-containing protein [Streptomyces sp. NPDC004111]|uniref:helix-turn-helix domain-containing protein n=1 Tax=Streptomyces sp. NPDC004111 TaxID=3364690 RepID=UPI0036C91E0C
MGKPVGVTARKVVLGLHLGVLRKNVGITQAEAAEVLPRFSEYKMQRLEKGNGVIATKADLLNLLELYGVSEGEPLCEELIVLHRDAAKTDWLTQEFDHLRADMKTFLGLEQVSRTVSTYHATLIPGLLQTQAYARSMFEADRAINDTTVAFVRNHTELRMRRKQESILRTERPVKLEAIIHEASLVRPVGDPEVMREQFDEIARLSQRDNIRIQVYRLRKEGPMFPHNFTILDLGKPLPTTVQADTPWGALSMSDKPAEVNRFTAWFSAMTASAESPEDTPKIMLELAKGLTDA